MSAKDNGWPAFPTPVCVSDDKPSGMNLRDYFAAKAMQWLMGRAWGDRPFAICAQGAYMAADAMLKARLAAPNTEK